jgi:hypothetical protein
MDTLTVTFSFQSSSAALGQETLFFLSGTSWQPVLSDGNVAPTETVVFNAADNSFTHNLTVVFGPSSNPTLTSLTGTVFTLGLALAPVTPAPVTPTPVPLALTENNTNQVAKDIALTQLLVAEIAAPGASVLLPTPRPPDYTYDHASGEDQPTPVDLPGANGADLAWQALLPLQTASTTPTLQRVRATQVPAVGPEPSGPGARDWVRTSVEQAPLGRSEALTSATASAAWAVPDQNTWQRTTDALWADEQGSVLDWRCGLAAMAIGAAGWAEAETRRRKSRTLDNDRGLED